MRFKVSCFGKPQAREKNRDISIAFLNSLILSTTNTAMTFLCRHKSKLCCILHFQGVGLVLQNFIFREQKKMKKLFSTTLLAALGFSLAHNVYADGIMQEPELWAGPFMGLSVAGGGGDFKTKYRDISYVTNTTTNTLNQTVTTSLLTTTQGQLKIDGNASGGLANLFLGYNFHKTNSKLIYGAQLEGTLYTDVFSLSQSHMAANVTLINFINPAANATTTTEFSVANSAEIRSIFSALGRGGFLVNRSTMVYGLVGPSAASFNLIGGQKWVLGISAGTGIEHKITEHWSMLAEYRFTYFSPDSILNTRVENIFLGQNTLQRTTNLRTRETDMQIYNNMAILGFVYRI